MKCLNPFSMNQTIHSYWYPIIKIFICLFILIILFFRNQIIDSDSNLLRFLITIISLILTISSILVIYVSIAEMISLSDRNINKKDQIHFAEYKTTDVSIKSLLDLLRSNDCMDIKVIYNSTIMHIGVASDNNVKDSVFFGKVYYIDGIEYETSESFESALIMLNTSDDCLSVIEIDDLPPWEYSSIINEVNE